MNDEPLFEQAKLETGIDPDREQFEGIMSNSPTPVAEEVYAGDMETKVEVPEVEVPALVLTAQDRCDRCGAQALARAELPSGFELLFCSHHMREKQAGLEEAGATIQLVSEAL